MTFYHDRERDLLVYKPQTAFHMHGLLGSVPEARQINGAYAAVPRTLRNCQQLRWLGYAVPPIITDANYDWPIEPGKKALPHQKVMANFQLLHPKSYNLSDPGTMKTNAALWMADWMMQQYPQGECRCLIIGLLNVLETVWASAIFKNFLSRRTFEILHGPAGKRQALLAKKPDFAIVNIDGVGVGAHTRKRFELDGFSKDLALDDKIKIVIIDEADGYIDHTTKRHRLARMVLEKRPYIHLLTGTPLSQSPVDAYGMSRLLHNAYGKGYKQFRDETMMQVSLYKWIPRKDGYEKAKNILTPAIRFDIKDVWQDAPPLTTQQRLVVLTEEQKKAMAALKRDLVIEMRSGKLIQAVNEAAARTKYLQISLGGVYDDGHKSHTLDAEPRYAEVERIIRSSNQKILIFVPLTNIIDLLYKRLSKSWRCGIINGAVLASKRPALIREFASTSAEEFKVMLLDAQSTAHGINEFVVADTVIWMAPIDKTRLYIQGNKRAHRPGQKWPTTVYQLVSNQLEKEMFHRLETNTSMQGIILDAIRRGDL